MLRRSKKYKLLDGRDMGLDYSMSFEIAMRNFFGDSAYHIADSAVRLKAIKEWFQKAIRLMKKRVLSLDTTTRHREILSIKLDSLASEIKSLKSAEDTWPIIYSFFSLSASFLGYDYVSGTILHTPFYHQTPAQNYSSKSKSGLGWKILEKQRGNLMTIKKELISKLKEEGHNTFDISLILNITEYEVKKILKNI